MKAGLMCLLPILSIASIDGCQRTAEDQAREATPRQPERFEITCQRTPAGFPDLFVIKDRQTSNEVLFIYPPSREAGAAVKLSP